MAPNNPQQHQHGLPPRVPGSAAPQRNGAGGAALTRSPMPDYGRSPTPGTPSRTSRRAGTFSFRYYTPAELEAISRRQGTRASGWDAELEGKRRKNYVQWIHALCKSLGLPYVVIETAVFYMHRYFALKSMAETDIWVMSMAAVFAASKSEDNPRALQDIIYHGLRPERVGATIKPSRTKLFAKTKADPQLVEQLRNVTLTAERALLYTLGFNFKILHPQTALLNASTRYKLDQFSHLLPGQPSAHGKDVRLTQTAVQMVNFVHNTTLSLQYPPQTIGLGVLFFTLKQLNCEPLENEKPWWMHAGASEHELEDVRRQILEVLNGPASASGPPDDGQDAEGGTAAAAPKAPATTGAQQSAAAAAPQTGGAGSSAALIPPITPSPAGSPAVARPARVASLMSPQFSSEMLPGAAAVLPQLSPEETRSDASDTTGAGQRSPGAPSPDFSPVVDDGTGGGGSLAGSKRRSPAAADTHDAPSAKRANTGVKAEQPAADTAGTSEPGWGAVHPIPDHKSAVGSHGVAAQVAAGPNSPQLEQQAPSTVGLDGGAGGESEIRPRPQPAQPGITTAVKQLSLPPLHGDAAATTGAAADVADMTGGTVSRDVTVAMEAAPNAGDAEGTIMSQDSVEPGELLPE